MSRLKITNARRKQRVRLSLRRTASGRPRLSVFRSSKHIYAQVIDDLKGETLASASSLEKAMRESGNTGANIDAAKAWAKAGYNGWPRVPSPAPDRSNCVTDCPNTAAYKTFRLCWHPHLPCWARRSGLRPD